MATRRRTRTERLRGNDLIHFDAGEVAALAVELPELGFKAANQIDAVLEEGAGDIEAAWRRNAEESAGEHGRLYPKAIDHERLIGLGLAFEIGPNPTKPQGRMQFEEGSVNQPPHLDGQKAADVEVPRIERRVMTALTLLGL